MSWLSRVLGSPVIFGEIEQRLPKNQGMRKPCLDFRKVERICTCSCGPLGVFGMFVCFFGGAQALLYVSMVFLPPMVHSTPAVTTAMAPSRRSSLARHTRAPAPDAGPCPVAAGDVEAL